MFFCGPAPSEQVRFYFLLWFRLLLKSVKNRTFEGWISVKIYINFYNILL